jgi:hypothetical protein
LNGLLSHLACVGFVFHHFQVSVLHFLDSGFGRAFGGVDAHPSERFSIRTTLMRH